MKSPIRLFLLLALTSSTVSAQTHVPQNQRDPFAANADPAPGNAEETTAPLPTLSICCETFSLDLATAAALRREGLGDAALYARMVTMTQKNEARQESLTVIRTTFDTPVKSEGVAEVIYATEFEPPELPNTVGVSIVPPKGGSDDKTPPSVPDTAKLKDAPAVSDLPALQTPAMPSAWTTRSTGITIDATATAGDANVLRLKLLIERVTHTGDSEIGQGLSKCAVPDFEKQALNCALLVTPNQPTLAGTLNRPPVSKCDPESANRVWFVFVTADPVKP